MPSRTPATALRRDINVVGRVMRTTISIVSSRSRSNSWVQVGLSVHIMIVPTGK